MNLKEKETSVQPKPNETSRLKSTSHSRLTHSAWNISKPPLANQSSYCSHQHLNRSSSTVTQVATSSKIKSDSKPQVVVLPVCCCLFFSEREREVGGETSKASVVPTLLLHVLLHRVSRRARQRLLVRTQRKDSNERERSRSHKLGSREKRASRSRVHKNVGERAK